MPCSRGCNLRPKHLRKLSQDKRFEPFNTADCRKIVEGLAQVAAKAGFPAAEKEARHPAPGGKKGKGHPGPGERPGTGALIGDRKYNLASWTPRTSSGRCGKCRRSGTNWSRPRGSMRATKPRPRPPKTGLKRPYPLPRAGCLPPMARRDCSAMEVSLTEAQGRQKEIAIALDGMCGVSPPISLKRAHSSGQMSERRHTGHRGDSICSSRMR